MPLFAFEVNHFFSFCETFVPPEASRFPQSRGAVMLPYASQVNHFFAFRLSSRVQCVSPVTREMHSMQTPPLCQHKN